MHSTPAQRMFGRTTQTPLPTKCSTLEPKIEISVKQCKLKKTGNPEGSERGVATFAFWMSSWLVSLLVCWINETFLEYLSLDHSNWSCGVFHVSPSIIFWISGKFIKSLIMIWCFAPVFIFQIINFCLNYFFRYRLFMMKPWLYSSSWIYINQSDRVLIRQHSCPFSAAGLGSAISKTQQPMTKWKLLHSITPVSFNPNFWLICWAGKNHDGFYDRIMVGCPSELEAPYV